MRGPTKKWVGAVLGTLLAMATPTMAIAKQAAPRAEFQTWDELDVSARINPRFDITLSSQTRFSTGQENPATSSNGVDLNIRVGDHLIVTPSYYLIASRTAAGSWVHSRVPILAATPTYEWGRWTLSDRNRVAQVSGAGSDFWLFQTRPRLDYAIGGEGSGTSLFVWDEVSYYSLFHTWSRNRFAAGTRIAANQTSAIDVYYVHQNDIRTRPHRIDGIGLTLELRWR
jgi:hypothetical protein